MGFAALLHDFRKHLDLPPYPMTTSGPAHALAGLRVPFTYLWSPALQPKPADWGSHIDVRLPPLSPSCACMFSLCLLHLCVCGRGLKERVEMRIF